MGFLFNPFRKCLGFLMSVAFCSFKTLFCYARFGFFELFKDMFDCTCLIVSCWLLILTSWESAACRDLYHCDVEIFKCSPSCNLHRDSQSVKWLDAKTVFHMSNLPIFLPLRSLSVYSLVFTRENVCVFLVFFESLNFFDPSFVSTFRFDVPFLAEFIGRKCETAKQQMWACSVDVFSVTMQCCEGGKNTHTHTLQEKWCGWITAAMFMYSHVYKALNSCLLSVDADVGLLVCLWSSDV